MIDNRLNDLYQGQHQSDFSPGTVYDGVVTELEVANVVGMITYQQELDLAALAETFDERDEITDVTYEPTDNHRADYI